METSRPRLETAPFHSHSSSSSSRNRGSCLWEKQKKKKQTVYIEWFIKILTRKFNRRRLPCLKCIYKVKKAAVTTNACKIYNFPKHRTYTTWLNHRLNNRSIFVFSFGVDWFEFEKTERKRTYLNVEEAELYLK